ncbi:hypothetical protein ACFONG_06130 [Uliginosibacterium paludis]|uniref:Uncharacterized protein n=1 Tax=Uliginosibacterium paludis TaxID=1615952 RepID=A0ABV2CMT1_9RHOO
MTTIDNTAFGPLEAEERLLNGVFKGPTGVKGRFGFRGDIAIEFQPKLADEKRPPEKCCEQVIAVANEGEPHISFLSGFLLSFGYLKLLAEVLGEALSPTGKYILYCDNIDLSKKFVIDYAGATFYILPIDEATVYNETLELLYLEKTELKRLDGAGKVDAIANAGVKFAGDKKFIKSTYEELVATMGPVRNPYENRPV